jgi:hypothetical protein
MLKSSPIGWIHYPTLAHGGCGRLRDDEGYFDVVDGRILRTENNLEEKTASVREKILKAIRAKART